MSTPLIGPQVAVAMAAIAYCPDPQPTLNKYLPGWKAVWSGAPTPDGNYAFIATDGNTYVISIRGSIPPFNIFNNWDEFANWVIEDLNAINQQPWTYSYVPGAMVSDGEMIAFTNLSNMKDGVVSIESFLVNFVVPANKPIALTGHSLGGSMASTYASYLAWTLANGNYTGNLSLYTFAAPAFGNQPFAQDLDNKIVNAWHYEIDYDIAPKFPMFLELELFSLLYVPSPAAKDISVTHNGVTITLREGLIGLGFLFEKDAYLQPSRNYTILNNGLDTSYTANTFSDWVHQVAYQHEIINYCKCLGVAQITCAGSVDDQTTHEAHAVIEDLS